MHDQTKGEFTRLLRCNNRFVDKVAKRRRESIDRRRTYEKAQRRERRAATSLSDVPEDEKDEGRLPVLQTVSARPRQHPVARLPRTLSRAPALPPPGEWLPS